MIKCIIGCHLWGGITVRILDYTKATLPVGSILDLGFLFCLN